MAVLERSAQRRRDLQALGTQAALQQQMFDVLRAPAVGSKAAPSYEEKTGGENPFDGRDVGSNAAPALADVDGDGDLDAAVADGLAVLGRQEHPLLGTRRSWIHGNIQRST